MIYFDNAATTWPKPRAVSEAVVQALRRYGANPGRSGHSMSLDTAMKVYETREAAAALFHAEAPEQVVFTQNCTHALNLAIKGLLMPGDHVIVSDLEHNSILRPVHALSEQGKIRYSVARVQDTAEETVAEFASLITPQTRLIACTHGSNVWGKMLPIQQLGALARERGVFFLVDAAQTAGVVPIHMQECGVDFLCMAGHKSLYGPSGTGLLITSRDDVLDTIIEGGTGSFSADFTQPREMPDRLESGTVNTMGILGLGAGIRYVQQRGIGAIYRHEMHLIRSIYRRIQKLSGILLYTDPEREDHLPVLSFNIGDLPSEQVTAALSDRGFAVRGGLHCAPLAHEKMGTLQRGAVRISVGAFNTMEQAQALCQAIAGIAAAS